MLQRLQEKGVRLLRWSEQYVKTDMVYLVGVWFWTNINFVTSTLLALLLAAACAHFLPREVYGTYQYFISLAGLVAAVSLSGMGSSVVQATARGYEGVLRAAFRAQLWWAVIPALVSGIAAVYYFVHGNSEVGMGLMVIALCTPSTQAYALYGGFLEGKRDFRLSFYLGFLISTATYVSLLCALFWVKSALLLISINLGVTALTTAYAYRTTLRRYQPNARIDPQAITYGRHLSVLSAWGAIVTQLDSVLVFHFLGPVSLAVYSFATLIPERLGSMFNFIGSASLPNLATQPLSYIRTHILSKVYRVLLAGAVTAALCALCAPVLFRFIFPRYLDSVLYMQWYAPIIVLFAVMSVTNAVLYAKRLTREIYLVGFAQPFLLIALQLPLLLHYGIGGMIAARLLTDSIVVLLMLLLLFKPLSSIAPNEI